MTLISDILHEKGRDVWSVSMDTSVYDALRLMADKNLGAVLVIEHGKLLGIFSERDYARKIILAGKSSRDTPVQRVMSRKVLYVGPDQSVDDCMALMTEKRIRHLPVLDKGRLIGVISIGDVVHSVISEQKFIIEQLEQYIGGAHVQLTAP